MERLARLRRSLERLFPERHLYVRSGTEIRGFVLTTSKQVSAAVVVCLGALWMGVASAAMVMDALSLTPNDQKVLERQASLERRIADREAWLNTAVAQLNETSGSLDGLAQSVEKRHRALALLVTPLKGQPGAELAVSPLKAAANASPVDRIRFIRMDQERLIAQAESFAKSRADRLRLAMRLAGLDPANLGRGSGGLGGPLIEGKDPKALAAVLDVDEPFAARVQHASASLDEMRSLAETVERTPLSAPVGSLSRSSSYGARLDPITGRPAFHPGLDLTGGFLTPIYATAPGVVSFTGKRSGYGNTIEIDHGGGFKTRYAHLQGVAVSFGQRVAVGQRIGAMGSTGRSTGPHLHYEVWVDGRPQNPDRFLKAGEYVQQTQ
jgi:murein DD-endopeptidase MepM/ murein hydrolase activator NlpD